MKKKLLTAGIILAACLPSFSSEASNNIIPTPSRNSYYQNVSSYTNITLGMADRERKEQEAWDREKKRRGKEYESDKQERRDRERWERQEEKKRIEENRHHKKDKKRKNDSDFERHRKWKFDPSQSGGEGD
ncbi:hypothetical protein [Phascolarctobacterium faecium]|uniref:hypothetical protein n=1 Tax=Phascolarctobacterium faecium TaxID=33025 RepID=UPI0027BA8AD0|nr:hypothetical protein [Phascolarctobacterium faecium]